MRKKRIMLIGPRGCGKTTLAGYLEEEQQVIGHTPNMIFGTHTIDVPGAYLECPWMHKHLIAIAQDAYCILMLIRGMSKLEHYPPGFAGAFRVPVLGVIVDKGEQEGEEEACIRQLQRAGIHAPYYEIFLGSKIGFKEIKEAVLRQKGGI